MQIRAITKLAKINFKSILMDPNPNVCYTLHINNVV